MHRGQSRNVGRKMAQLLGTDYQDAFAPEVTMCDHPHPNLWDRPAYRDMSGAAEGNAIITNLPQEEWSWGSYPAYDDCYTVGAWARHTAISRATLYIQRQSRYAAAQPNGGFAELSWHFTLLSQYASGICLSAKIAATRLTSVRARHCQIRQAQVSEILYVIDELKRADEYNEMPARPIVLAGDFNAQPDSPEMEMLQRHFRLLTPENKSSQLWTHNTHRILIDHILLYDPAEQFEVICCGYSNQDSARRPSLMLRPTVGIFALG